MATLIIGGTGQTGSQLASLLDASKRPFFLTSRSGNIPAPYTDRGVRFDWDDQSTFENPFNTAAKAQQTIEKVYITIMIKNIMNPLPTVRKFLDLAKNKGVKRFVLLSSSASTVGENPHGTVHEYIASMPNIEYAVLRPTWFIENFGTMHRSTIKDQDFMSSLTKDGRIPFISVNDIAQAAFDALNSEKSWNGDKYIVGPDLVSYDEAMVILSKILGRSITHKRITSDEWKTVLPVGTEEELSIWLAKAQEDAAAGSEERILEREKYVGKVSLEEYFETNKALWIN